ncbi:hypothetical protein PanWU01x14_273230, partial [Parasponia andersonii]
GSRRLSTTCQNVRRGKSCATENLPANLENDRTIGITSCNKILPDSPRKCMKKEESHSESLQPAPKGKHGSGSTYWKRTLPDNILAACKAKVREVRIYPLEADPPSQHFSSMQSRGWRGQGLPVGSRPHPDEVLAACKGKVRGVRAYPLEADPPQITFYYAHTRH